MITIHAGPGQRLSTMTRQLVALANGDRDAVRSGRGGLVVSDALAHTYLTLHLTGPEAPAPPPPRLPAALAEVTRNQEVAGGLLDQDKADQAKAAGQAPVQPSPRRRPAGQPARTKERLRV